MEKSPEKPPRIRPFIPAKRSAWLLPLAQQVIRTSLFLNNRLHIRDGAMDVLQSLPSGAGVVLALNHADETDPRVCIEVSRRSQKSFVTMCNREAFDEMLGMAGFVLRRLGYFSIERGRHDAEAVDYAVEVVKGSRDALVMFPEGEIYYLNEEVQPLHKGAVEIGMRAVLANRESDPNWDAYIIPMAIKYNYSEPLDRILEERISGMEKRLMLKAGDGPLAQRVFGIQKTLLEQEITANQLTIKEFNDSRFTHEIKAVQKELLTQMEQKHAGLPVSHKRTIDRAWQLSAELRDSGKRKSSEERIEIREDIQKLKEVAELSSWRPHYYLDSTSQNRLAEAVLKLERAVYKMERPRQLGKREVHVDIGPPISLGATACKYQEDPRSVRDELTAQLQGQIQSLINNLVETIG